VASTIGDRDTVAKCLSMGATDYLVKPLRHNELRNIWTRIWWWRQVGVVGSG
jgi:response regulator of citrate/malate metabolism